MAKPFVKWAGGKGKLLHTLEEHLPNDFRERQDVTYIDPFVGGGAVLFHMLKMFPNIHKVIINDINPALINCYRRIQEDPKELIAQLLVYQQDYYRCKSLIERKDMYYALRTAYNAIVVENRNTIEAASLFMFFNKTGFNGLYRENRNGGYNVPIGSYKNPVICNESVICEAHNALQGVNILCGDYQNVLQHVHQEEYNFFYFDPPYRPLLGASNFKDYSRNIFGDPQQEDLALFCNELNEAGYHFLLSNSDSEIEQGVNYFQQLYAPYHFDRILAPRYINAYMAHRHVASEILIWNYEI